jgi:hypothetical protein
MKCQNGINIFLETVKNITVAGTNQFFMTYYSYEQQPYLNMRLKSSSSASSVPLVISPPPLSTISSLGLVTPVVLVSDGNITAQFDPTLDVIINYKSIDVDLTNISGDFTLISTSQCVDIRYNLINIITQFSAPGNNSIALANSSIDCYQFVDNTVTLTITSLPPQCISSFNQFLDGILYYSVECQPPSSTNSDQVTIYIIVGVVLGVVVLTVILAVIFTQIPSIRDKLFPFRNRSRHTTQLST